MRMNLHIHNFRPHQTNEPETTEGKPSPETLAALLDYVAGDIDVARFGLAHDLVVAAAGWLRLQSAD
jgi:hypothetical protein